MDNKEFLKNKDNVIAIIGIVFILVLAIFARINNTSDNKTLEDNNIKDEEVQPSEDTTSEKTEQDNYYFTYTIDNNNQVSIIEGKNYNNKQKFSIIENGVKHEYAKIDENYLKLENGKYEIVPNINDYFKYIELDEIMNVLEYSLYEEEDNDKIYEIDITDLIDRYNMELEYNGFEDFKDDKITITEKDSKISKIVLDYSNYFSYIASSSYTFKVTMNFDRYGSVEDFDI